MALERADAQPRLTVPFSRPVSTWFDTAEGSSGGSDGVLPASAEDAFCSRCTVGDERDSGDPISHHASQEQIRLTME